ncbi:MAG: nucleotidyltransferase domain-containing protein [bacterium]
MWLDQLASKPKLRLLRYLARHAEPVTGRQLALAANVQPKRAREALATLAAMGLVHERKAGRASLYTLNRGHYAVRTILIPGFKREIGWLDDLGRRLMVLARGQIHSVVLYGSWARGDGRPTSDVDLLLIVRDGTHKDVLERSLEGIRTMALTRYGVPVSLLVLSTDEVAGRVRARSRFIRDILEQGRILAGRPLSDVLHGA